MQRKNCNKKKKSQAFSFFPSKNILQMKQFYNKKPLSKTEILEYYD